MATPKTIIVGDVALRPMSDPRSWARSHGTYIAGRAYIDGADETAAEMEARWGCDRLRLLVPPDLREKFDRQRYLFNQAIWHGELESVRREAGRMVNAWLALDRAATAAGKTPLAPQVWEVALADGTVAAIVQDSVSAKHAVSDGRRMAVYTLDEIGRMLSRWQEASVAKLVFPGAEVTRVEKSIDDPLNAIHDTDDQLDDPIDDIGRS